jgi:hypothetical protein
MTAAYPLQWPDGWPRTKIENRRLGSPFQTTFEKARRDLIEELRLMKADRGAVISSWLQLRPDGLPYAAGARQNIPDPGVAVYFMRNGRQLVLARDAFCTIHDNLRSIGLALAHLRGLERHGGAPIMERAFEGFVSLPGRNGQAAGPSCWEILDVPPGAAREFIEDRFRELAKTTHPDLGGSVEAFTRIKSARDEALKAGTR